MTLDQLRDIITDYDADLDDVEYIPESFHCEDDNVPILCLEASASVQTPTTRDPTSNLEQAGL